MNTTVFSHKIIGRGPNLVLIHGFGFNHEIWSPIISILSQYFTLFLLDLPGFGNNIVPTDYSNLKSVLTDLLKTLPKKAHYLGWSFGGLILYALAMAAPQRINKLIFTGSAPCFIKKENWSGVEIDVFQRFLEEIKENPKARWRRFITEQLRDLLSTNHISRDFMKRLTTKPCPNVLTMKSAMNLLMQADYRETLPTLTLPQYYFFGEHDRLALPEVATQLNANSDYLQTTVIQDAGHLVFISHSTFFTEEVIRFLSDDRENS